MKNIYIKILEFIISVIAIILKQNGIEDDSVINKKEDQSSNSKNNTFYKLLTAKNRLEQHKDKI